MPYLKIIPFLFILFFDYCIAQDSSSIIDHISPDIFSPDDDVNIFLDNLVAEPIELNKAEVKDLLQLPLMTFENAKLIIAYRDSINGFKDISELYSIPNIDKNIIFRILPVMSIHSDNLQPSKGKLDYTGKFYKRNNLNGYKFLDYRILNRFIITNSNNDIKGGITFEKDPGEKNFNNYSSFYLEVKDFLSFDKIIFGDYDIGFGEGLVNWSYSNYFKISDAFLSYKMNTIKPHTYINENFFYRGLSALTSTKYFDFIFFFSHNKVDAELDSNNFIKKFSSSLNSRNIVNETAFGSVIKYQPNEIFYLSFFLNSSIFDKPDYYNRKIFPSFSFYYNLSLNNLNLSGEFANDKIRTSFSNTFKYYLTSSIVYQAQLNYIPKNFISFHRRYFNKYDLNGLNYSNNIIYFSSLGEIVLGIDYMGRINSEDEMPDGSNLSFNFISKRFSNLVYKTNYYLNIDNYISSRDRYKKHIFINEINYFLDYQTKLRTKFEYNVSTKKDRNVNGYIFNNEINYKMEDFIFSFNFTFFSQNDERLYRNIIENDFSGSYFPFSYEGSGSRWYISTFYKFFNNLNILLFYSQTNKRQKDNTFNAMLNVEI